MSEHLIDPTIDKSTWGDGPWQTEPDRVEWTHAGLPCLAVRHPRHGNWCGYAAVPPGHPLHRKSYNAVDLHAHGGVNYADRCSGHICHVPKPGEPDDVWWFGFACDHCWDVTPGIDATLRACGVIVPELLFQTTYKTLAYVQAETNRLADQLAARA